MFELVDAEKANYPVSVLCEVLGVSRSGFYALKSRPPSARSKSDAKVAVEVAAAHAKSRKRYGSPRVHRALRKKGVRVGRKRVERLMREKGLVGRRKRPFRRTTDSNHASPIAPNLVARDFNPTAPNEVWAGDVTYIATAEGWSYLAVLLDLYSRRVVGWAMSACNDTALALEALERATRCRAFLPLGLVHHTDRGSPYASDDYRAALTARGMVASMSRRATVGIMPSPRASSRRSAPSWSTTSATSLGRTPRPPSATTSSASTTSTGCTRTSTTSVRSNLN